MNIYSFVSSLTLQIPFRPTTAEIWVLEVCSYFIVLCFIFKNMCGVKGLRKIGLCENRDLLELENFLMYDETHLWQGSAFNVNGYAIPCSEQFSVFEFLPLAPVRVLCELQSRLPSSAAANIPFKRPADELNESCRLLRRPRERGRDLRTQELERRN